MSQLIDKLVQASQAEPQPIGFRAGKDTALKPKMLLIASLAQAGIDSLADYVTGADAGLLPVSESASGIRAFKEVSQAVADIPWGGWLKDSALEDEDQLASAGCDFVVFPAASTALAALQDDKVGRILEMTASLSDGLLRAVDKLPVDAVLVGGKQDNGRILTWQHLMHFQQCANLLTKPLLASIPSSVTASELQALLAAGVNGVVVEVEAGQPAGRLLEMSRVISELTLPRRQLKKPAVLVPRVSSQVATEVEESEEE